MPVGGFRQFANDINSKGPTSSVMPTYDNFRKGYKNQSNRKKKITDSLQMAEMFYLDYAKAGEKGAKDRGAVSSIEC